MPLLLYYNYCIRFDATKIFWWILRPFPVEDLLKVRARQILLFRLHLHFEFWSDRHPTAHWNYPVRGSKWTTVLKTKLT